MVLPVDNLLKARRKYMGEDINRSFGRKTKFHFCKSKESNFPSTKEIK